VGLVCGELFRADLGGYGGYGRTAQRLAEHFSGGEGLELLPILSRDLGLVARPSLLTVRDRPVLALPSLDRLALHRRRFVDLMRGLELGALLTLDYQVHYEYPLWAAPRVPLIVYLRDPKSTAEWQRLAQVPGALAYHRRPTQAALCDIARQEAESFARVRCASERFGRPIAFASNARLLVERGRAKLDLEQLDAFDLPGPVELPPEAGEPVPEPTVLWLGRLDPDKRPWTVLALARRFPEVRFVVAGAMQRPELVEPFLRRDRSSPNVVWAGHLEGAALAEQFRGCRALLNTSLHEGLPVSFLEAFGHARPVVSGVDPDGLVTRFGYRAEVPVASGMDAATLEGYEAALRACLDDETGRRARGAAAREYVASRHSLASFERHLRIIGRHLGLDWTPERPRADP
jgi:glycosyltransferase involved in cell wall biosynthesis